MSGVVGFLLLFVVSAIGFKILCRVSRRLRPFSSSPRLDPETPLGGEILALAAWYGRPLREIVVERRSWKPAPIAKTEADTVKALSSPFEFQARRLLIAREALHSADPDAITLALAFHWAERIDCLPRSWTIPRRLGLGRLFGLPVFWLAVYVILIVWGLAAPGAYRLFLIDTLQHVLAILASLGLLAWLALYLPMTVWVHLRNEPCDRAFTAWIAAAAGSEARTAEDFVRALVLAVAAGLLPHEPFHPSPKAVLKSGWIRFFLERHHVPDIPHLLRRVELTQFPFESEHLPEPRRTAADK